MLISHCGTIFCLWCGVPVWRPVAVGGFLGVELFFVLSGFLVGRILIRQAALPFPQSWANFMARRWLRTLPLYYVWLLILAVAWPPYVWPPDHHRLLFSLLPSYLVFAQNLITPIGPPHWFDVSWSLTVEEWFYLIAASVVLPLSGRLGLARTLAPLLAVLLLGPALYRAAALPSPALPLATATSLDQIGFGVAMAWLSLSRPAWFTRLRWAAPFGAALALAFFHYLNALFGPHLVLRQAIAVDMVAIGAALCLPAAVRWRQARFWGAGLIRAISTHSYGLYLTHLTLLEVVAFYRDQWHLGPATCIASACGLIVTVPVLSWRLLEQPALRLRPGAR